MKVFNWTKRAFLLMVVALATTVCVSAQQQGDMAAGGNLVIGTGNGFTNIGLGAKFLYNVTDPIRLAGEFDYFLKKSNLSMWDFSAYGHYLFPVAETITVYPAVGLGIIGSTVDLGPYASYYGGSASGSDFAFSLGGGADFQLTDKLFATGEIRIKINDGSRFYILGGIAYKF
jgi:outer membrane protein X